MSQQRKVVALVEVGAKTSNYVFKIAGNDSEVLTGIIQH